MEEEPQKGRFDKTSILNTCFCYTCNAVLSSEFSLKRGKTINNSLSIDSRALHKCRLAPYQEPAVQSQSD